MILYAVAYLLLLLVVSGFGLVGNAIPDPPSWVTSSLAQAGTIFQYIHAFDAWLPVNLVLTVVGAVLALKLVGYALSLIRMVLSYLTFGGGAT